MKILVNGQEAVLKQDASFEYVSENPLFTEAEDYTLEIPFPMDDCPQNIAIFGALHVKGVDISRVQYQCEIVCEAFSKVGILTITSVSETEVKGQFLEGMSQENFASSLPDIYLTDMDFSAYDGSDGSWVYDVNEDKWVNPPGAGWLQKSVYDSGKEGFINPIEILYGEYEPVWINMQIYLYHLLDVISNVIGWQIDYSVLDANATFRRIVVANARHTNWRNTQGGVRPLAYSLPKWKLKEFLNNIGIFFGCTYDVDANAKTVKFVSYAQKFANTLALDVLDNFTSDMNEKEEPSFIASKSVRYSDDCDPDKLDNCPWLVNDPRIILKQDITTRIFLRDILDSTENYTSPFNQKTLYHLTDIDQYAVITEIDTIEDELGTHNLYTAKVVNQYNFTELASIESKVSPCPLVARTAGATAFFGGLAPSVKVPERDPDGLLVGYEDITELPDIVELVNEDTDDKSMWYDNLWLYIYDETTDYINTKQFESRPGTILDEEEIKYYTYYITESTYYFNPGIPFVSGDIPTVDETKLYRFKFLAQTLPSPTNIFLIQGKKYACVRLTAHFTVLGMSELVEGEFYEITD